MLAPTPKGNLGPVWDSLAADAERRMNGRVALAAPTHAELTPDEGDWFLVRVMPGEDLRALRHLARRRFGVFRPMHQRRDVVTDALLSGWEPVFPGWLMVFTWDIQKMQSRIRSCPGVTGILCHRVSQQPVSINVKEKDGVYFVDRLRELSFTYKDVGPRSTDEVRGERQAKKSTVRRLTKPQRKALQKLKDAVKRQGLWDQSTWEEANRLEPHERIALLQRALNAQPSQVVVQ